MFLYSVHRLDSFLSAEEGDALRKRAVHLFVAATPAGQSDLWSAFERDLLCAEETVSPSEGLLIFLLLPPETEKQRNHKKSYS